MSIIRKLAAAVAILVLTSVSGPAVAQVKTDPEVAKALAMKAAALVKEQGVDAAKPIFHAQGEWRHDDIYVSVMDLTGTWLVYPVKPEGEGKSVINVKDADGKMLVQELVNTAKDKGEGWVEYRWLNPVSNKIEPKVTFVKMVPERNVFVYVGVYK
ncbi:MAG: cache domain-containing protein [Rhodospirillaceae bacterium]